MDGRKRLVMLTTLQNEDIELDLLNVSKQDIYVSLTIDDVYNFLHGLGVEQIIINRDKNYLICPTICHNSLEDAESMKLYWYQNHKIFRCYTECNESMTIFQLYQKFIYINENRTITEEEAIDYVKRCIKHFTQAVKRKTSTLTFDVEKYNFSKHIPILPEYSSNVLSCFTHYHHPLWLRDGITSDAMDKFQIGFCLSQNKITIPHFDINGRLIGIRARAVDPKDAEENGKYRPIQIGNTIYSHPLQFNLYGIHEHQNGIKKRRSAIIVEGEKSVLLDDEYYGEYSNTVACCGSTFNKYHISLLTDILGANEIIVALDKEYEDWRDEKALKYRKKLEDLCNKYKLQAKFSYIWDYNNLLKEKDSPFDRGKEIFDKLFRERVKVK